MTTGAAPPGWYPDPQQLGQQRYFDGGQWTEHRAPLPMPPYGMDPRWVQAPWKGAKLGRPQYGPGALADPGRRLAAQLLDGLVFIPVFAAFIAMAVVLVAPHAGPIFPRVNSNPYSRQPTPGIVWLYLAGFGGALVASIAFVVYEAVATARYGRTLGKAWLHIRPLRSDGHPLSWGRAWGRAAAYRGFSIVPYLGILNFLWCLWDENRQCLHDKAADTIVVQDSSPTDQVPVQQTGVPPTTWSAQQPYAAPGAYYGASYGQGGQAPFVARTNGLAVASLVCSAVGLIFIGVPSVVGIIFGFVGRSQVRRSAGAQRGSGFALAGIIVGFAFVILWTLIFTLAVTMGSSSNTTSPSVLGATIATDYSAAVPHEVPACPSTTGVTCLDRETREIAEGIAHFTNELSNLQLPAKVEPQQVALVSLGNTYSQQLLSLVSATTPQEYQQRESQISPDGQSEIAAEVQSLVTDLESLQAHPA